MKSKIKNLLTQLNLFAKEKNIIAEFMIHVEKSNLIRLANSAVSLNTTEEQIKLYVTAHRGRKTGAYNLTTDLSQIDKMKNAIYAADEIAKNADEVNYDITLTPLPNLPDDDRNFDPALANISSDEKLNFINEAAAGLESEKIVLSGIFSSGAIFQAFANTLSDNILFYSISDAQISFELIHEIEKWEIAAGQSAVQKNDLNPQKINAQLNELLVLYKNSKPEILPTGNYDVILSGEALAELIEMMEWIGFNGGMFKRKMSFLRDEHIGKKIFDEKLSVIDDPTVRQTFPRAFDYNGNIRRKFPLVKNGVFKNFIWDRDSADEFKQKETAHDVPALNLVIPPGNKKIPSINDLAENGKTTLFVPHLHYMNIVNVTEGKITACSRFGALLFDENNATKIPFNFRLTDTFFNFFKNIEWISDETVAVNMSGSYGTRAPSAALVPKFIKLKNINIPHSNKSF